MRGGPVLFGWCVAAALGGGLPPPLERLRAIDDWLEHDTTKPPPKFWRVRGPSDLAAGRSTVLYESGQKEVNASEIRNGKGNPTVDVVVKAHHTNGFAFGKRASECRGRRPLPRPSRQ